MHRPWLLALILLAPLLPMPGAAQSAPGGPLYAIPDARDDVTMGSGIAVPVPSPVGDPYDILALRVDQEDSERLEIEVEFRDFRTMWQTRSFLNFAPRYDLKFKIRSGDVVTSYTLSPRSWNPGYLPDPLSTPPAQPMALSASLCIESGYECYNQPAAGAVHWRENKVRFTVLKAALLGELPLDGPSYGRTQAKPAVPNNLPVGTTLTFRHFMVTSFSPTAYDIVPNPGETPPPYSFTKPMANGEIKAYVPRPKKASTYGYGGYSTDLNNTTTVAVTPQTTSVVPIEIANRASGKRIVELGVEFLDPAASQKWDLQIVKNLEIPRGETRAVNLIVNASKELAHRETAVIRVHARSIGYPEQVGVVRIELQATLAPSPQRTILYWHGAKPTYGSFTFNPFTNLAEPQWVNALEEDPRADMDAQGFTPRWSTVELDTETSHDLVFDPKEPVKAQLRLSASVPQQLTVRLRLMRAEEIVAEQKVLADLTPTPTTVNFNFLVKPDMTRIKSGGPRLGVDLRVYREDVLNNVLYSFPVLHPKQSRIELPLIEDPLETLRPAVPKVFGLHAVNTTEEFVNPGKTRRYEIVVVNEGTENETAMLFTNADRDDWEIRIEPGTKYRLKPGESVTVAVFVKARLGATEGEALRVDLVAQAERDERAVTRLPILTTAITQPELPDQAGPYQGRAEDNAKRADVPAGKSPGPGFLLLGAAALFAFALVRRRR